MSVSITVGTYDSDGDALVPAGVQCTNTFFKSADAQWLWCQYRVFLNLQGILARSNS